MNITVGEVSSVIAALINVIHFFVPLALAILVVGATKENMSAISWTAVSTTLHGSHWASLFRTDSALSVNVDGSIKMLLRLGTFVSFIIFAASIITPLGLSDIIVASQSLKDVPFPYIKDVGPFGLGTPSRSALGFNRECGFPTLEVCPGKTSTNDITIPQDKFDLFQSGLKEQSQTVSSFFDIQYRSWGTQQDPELNNGDTFTVGTYRQLGSLLLNNKIEAVEGLLVDSISGGITFRNHTLPVGLTLGATWTEDLLVMEPETQCVNTNLTFDFTMSGKNGTVGNALQDLFLTDRGGFVNIDHTKPVIDESNPEVNPDLDTRANLGAWYFNALIACFFNVTNPNPNKFAYMKSSVGKTFALGDPILLSAIALNIASYDEPFNTFIAQDGGFGIENNSNVPAQANPFFVTRENFTEIFSECSGQSSTAPSNMKTAAIGCGIVYGAPRLANGDVSLVMEAGSKWTMPIYSCATATKVSIKTYTLRFNGTEGLKSLVVDAVSPQNSSNLPTWGIENNSGMNMVAAKPLWGLVSSTTGASDDLDTVKSRQLYLPGYVDAFSALTANEGYNLPGQKLHADVLASMYSGHTRGDTVDVASDYTGRSSFSMFVKWQELANTTTGTSQILNLIFTDIMANGLVGTKSWLTSSAASLGNSLSKRDDSGASSSTSAAVAQVAVREYQRSVRFNWLYGIPAYVVLAIAGAILLATFGLLLAGRTGFGKMKAYLNATSPGRILSVFLYPNECPPQIPAKQWARSTGAKKVNIGQQMGWIPRASEAAMYPSGGQQVGTGYASEVKVNNLPGYENDHEPLVDGKMGHTYQMTPMPPPSQPPMPIGAAQHMQPQYPMGGFHQQPQYGWH